MDSKGMWSIFQIGASVDDKSAQFLSAVWPTVGCPQIQILAEGIKEFDASIRKNARDCRGLLPARCIMV
jgi:hypothetical protein